MSEREQPAAPVVATEPAKGSKGPQVSVLHQILGVMIVACQPPCQVIGSIQMRQNGLFETPEFVLFQQRLTSPLIHTIEDKTPKPAILFPESNSHSVREYTKGLVGMGT